MDKLLTLLSTSEYITGERLCEALGVTRAAVWKRMEKLRQEGYLIVAAGKRGYRLEASADSLLPGYILQETTTTWAGRGEIAYHKHVDSTNTLLKQMAHAGAPKGSLAVCELQTGGKGRLGRGWEAGEGENLLQSLLLCPALPVEQAPLCTLAAAVASAQAIEDTVPGLRAGIKWPNDIVLGGKKCVGILSELSADMDGIGFIVMGVGINVNQQGFAGELAEKATSLWLEREKQEKANAERGGVSREPIPRRALLCAYLRRMEAAVDALEREGLPGILAEYQGRSVTLGARVQVIGAQDNFVGIAKSIDDTGALLVQDEQGTLRRVLSGDVSVRGVMGYV